MQKPVAQLVKKPVRSQVALAGPVAFPRQNATVRYEFSPLLLYVQADSALGLQLQRKSTYSGVRL